MRVGAPFAFHKVECGETQHDGALEFGHEHTHEADGGVVVNAANDFIGLLDGNPELIPGDAADLSVGQRNAARLEDVSDVVLANNHLGGVKVNLILVVAFRFAKGVVIVDVLGIGQGGVAALIAFSLLEVGR